MHSSAPPSPFSKTLSSAIFERHDSAMSSELSYNSADVHDTDSQHTNHQYSRHNSDVSSPPVYSANSTTPHWPEGEGRRPSMLSLHVHHANDRNNDADKSTANTPNAIPLKSASLRSSRVPKVLCCPCFATHTVLSFVERKVPLFVKLACLTVPSLICLIILSIFLSTQSVLQTAASTRTDRLSHTSQILSELMTAVQHERSVMIGYTQSNFTKFAEDSKTRMLITSQYVSTWEKNVERLSSERYTEPLQKLTVLFSELDQQRALFTSNSLPAVDGLLLMVDYYERLQSLLTQVMDIIQSDIASDFGVSSQAVALTQHKKTLTDLKFAWNSKASVMVLTTLYGTWNIMAPLPVTAEILLPWIIYQQANGRETDCLNYLAVLFTPQAWTEFQEGYLPLKQAITPVETMAMSTLETLPQQVDPEEVYRNITRVIDFLEDVEFRKFQEIEDVAHTYTNQGIAQSVVALFVLAFVVIPLIFLTIVFCRIIYKPVITQRRNFNTALDIAEAIIDLKFDSPGVLKLKAREEDKCSPLEVAFKQILENFESYMPYIPRHLLMQDESGDNDDHNDDADTISNASFGSSLRRSLTGGSNSVQGSSHALPRSQSRSTGISKTGSSGGSGSRRPRGSMNSSGIRASMATSMRQRTRQHALSRKHVTIMVVDMNDFCKISQEMDYDSLQRLYAEYVKNMAHIMKQSNGLMHSFAGGIFVGVWGALSHKQFEVAKKAAAAALQMVYSTRSNPNLAVRVRVGISSGTCLCGELGSDETRALQVVGAPMSIALGLTKLAKRYECSILTDYATFKAINFDFDLKQQDVLIFTDLNTTSTMNGQIYQLVANKGLVEDEWMYTMEDAAKKSTYASYNKAWKCVQNGEFEEANALLDEFKTRMRSVSSTAQNEDAIKVEVASATGLLEEVIKRGRSDAAYRYRAFCFNWRVETNLDGGVDGVELV